VGLIYRRVEQRIGHDHFLATSYLEEADYLCDRVAIIDEGKLIVTGRPKELKASIGKNLISLKLTTGLRADFIKLLQGLEYVERIEERDDLLEFSLKTAA